MNTKDLTNSNNESLLQKAPEENKDYYITSDGKIIDIKKLRKERLGYAMAFLATFILGFISFYSKIVQRAYPDDFHTIPFLFLRSFSLVPLGFFHAYITNNKVVRPKDIPFKFWFFVRTNVNFLYNICQISALLYLRASTVQIIVSTTPIFVLFLAHFIIKEELYKRYYVGVVMGFVGSAIIILNDHTTKKSNAQDKKEEEKIENRYLLIGIILSIIATVSHAMINLSNKILASNKVPASTQVVYVGFTTMAYGGIITIFTGGLCLKIGYILMSFMHGVNFYLYNITINKSFQLAPINKVIIITFLQIVVIFVLAGLFLGEPVYYTDIIGACLILSFTMYNTLHPIRPKVEGANKDAILNKKANNNL